jgi:putative ABC transport system permease protein
MSRDDARWFRALLRLFPSEFRGDFGRQMTDDFRDQRDDAAASHGARGIRRLWLSTVADILWRAPQEHLDVLRRDASHAIRLLRRRPASTATVIASIAIGIGLNAALFTVVRGVLWQSLPFPDSDRLARIVEVGPDARTRDLMQGDFVALRDATREFSGVATSARSGQTIVEPGEPEELPGMMVSEAYFETLGAKPVLGRTFASSDYAASNIEFTVSAIANRLDQRAKGQPPIRSVVVISHHLWHRRFLERPDIVGQQLRLASGIVVEIVGVMGPEMAAIGPRVGPPPEYWMPQSPQPARQAGIRETVARLAPGRSLDGARAELAVVGPGIVAAFPGPRPARSFRATPLLETIVQDVRTQLTFLFGAALCVLLVTCVNVIHLFLANAAGRRLELATRVALGATRATLIRQTLTESALLAVIGGAGGLLLAAWGLPLLLAIAPPGIPRLNEIEIGWWTYAFAAAAAIGVALSCGIAASLPLTMVAPWRVLGTARSGSTLQGRHARRMLAVCEIAVALVLVVASILMLRSLRAMAAHDLGFDPQGVITAALPAPARPALDADAHAIVHEAEAQVIDAVRRLPGVIAAGVGGSPMGLRIGVGGVTLPGDPRELPMVGLTPVSVGYFEALGARLKEGRFFTTDDRAGVPAVAIVSESTARRFWPSRSAVGQTLILPANGPLQVVGVVADMTEERLEVKGGGIFIPHVQSFYVTLGRMLIKTDRDPQTLVPAIKAIVRRVNPDHPFPDVIPLQAEINVATAPRRFILQLIGMFSLLGLGLAVIGVYGVLAESVAERVPEIGVRIALGAQPADVVALVVRQGIWMVTIGLGVGFAGAVFVSRQMSAMVFGIGTLDPLSYVIACALIVLAGLAACAIPARRAVSLDPVVALRSE